MITAVSLATNRPSVSNFCASLAGDHYLRAVLEEAVGAVCTTTIFTTTLTAAPSSNNVATATTVATTAATETDDVTATALTRAEPTWKLQPTARPRLLVIAPAPAAPVVIAPSTPVAAPPAPVRFEAAPKPYV